MRRLPAALALGATLLVAGCGQKGPLYLPDKNGGVIATPQAQPPPAQRAPEQTAPQQSAPAPAAAPPSGSAPQSASPVPPKPEDKNGDSAAPK